MEDFVLIVPLILFSVYRLSSVTVGGIGCSIQSVTNVLTATRGLSFVFIFVSFFGGWGWDGGSSSSSDVSTHYSCNTSGIDT